MKRRDLLLLLSLALSLSALVALQTFSQRVATTVARDSKNFLAADFRVQAWRAFDDTVLKAVEPEAKDNRIAYRTDFVATAEPVDGAPFTVNVAALSGPYPFYGNWVMEPALKVEDLKNEPVILLDKGMKERGFHVGSRIRLGSENFRVVGFIFEEPQTVASAFSTGPRVMIHRDWLPKTGLLGPGSRAFYQLLVKSPLSTREFTRRFRSQAPDPHWRLITPERANRQASGILDRMRGFLSFVLLAGLFLGGAGLFMIFRSRFIEELPVHLTLRCLGMKSSALVGRALRESLGLAFLSWVPGSLLGILLERRVVAYASLKLGVSLSDSQPWQAPLTALVAAVAVVGLAVLLPLRETLRVSVQQAFRESDAKTQGLSRSDLFWMALVSLSLTLLFAGSWRLTVVFLGGLGVTIALLTSLVFLVSLPLEFVSRRRTFALRHAVLSFVRQRSNAVLVTVTLGLASYLVSVILFVGSALQKQIDFSGRMGVPNLFFLGVGEGERNTLSERVPSIEYVPVIQARLTEIRGEAIREDDSSPDNEDAEVGSFYRTREYVVTKRASLGMGENLVVGESIFGAKVENGIVRASLEKRFAERIGLQVGDDFKIEIAGVALPATVRSLRTVDWFNLHPNFFIVLNEEDMVGAPFNYVGFARSDPSEIPGIQRDVSRRHPGITVMDGDSIGKRLLNLLSQLSMAVFSVSAFAVGSCALVFAGMLLARRSAKIRELSLYKCLGVTTRRLAEMLIQEMTLSALVAVGVGLLCSVATVALISRFFLDIPWVFPPINGILAIALGVPFVTTLGGWLLVSPWLRISPAQLLRSTDDL